MKVEGYLFAAGFVFYTVVAAVYAFVTKGSEPVGITVLALTAGLAAIVGFYVLFTGRRLSGPRPEDRTDATIDEAAGELGFFSPHSWWPLLVGAAAAITVLGLIFAAWLLLLGAVALVLASIGFVLEYYKGEFARS